MQKIIEKILNLIKLFQEINFQEKIKNLSKNYYEFCEFVDTNVARGYKNTIEFLIKFQEKSNKIFHRLETITNQEIIDIILMNIIKIQKNFYDILINLYNIGKKISVGIKNIIVFFYKDIKELELANHLKKKFNIIRFFRKIKDHWDNFRDTDFYVRHLKLSATPEQMGYLNEEIHVPIYRPVLYILGVINLAIWNYAQYYDPFAWAMGESDILAPLFMYMAIHHLNDDNIVGSGWETNWGGRYDQPNLWARMGEEEDEDWEAYLDDKDASDFEDELLDYYINSWSDMGDKYTLVYKEEDDKT